MQRFVRAELLVALSDPHSATVRHTAGSVVTALAARNSRGSGGLASSWPELLPSIAALLDAAQAGGGSGEAALLGAAGGLSCVAKLCEDKRLDEAAAEAFVPRLLAFLGAPSPDSRLPALTALLHLCGPPMATALANNLGPFMQGLSALTRDPSPAVRQLVCQCIVALVETAPEQVVPAFSALAEFMLHASGNSAQEPEVAMAALEFWVPCCNCEELGAKTVAEPAFLAVLPRLIPLLLNVRARANIFGASTFSYICFSQCSNSELPRTHRTISHLSCKSYWCYMCSTNITITLSGHAVQRRRSCGFHGVSGRLHRARPS